MTDLESSLLDHMAETVVALAFAGQDQASLDMLDDAFDQRRMMGGAL